ncbi:DUF5110 domain-containing protein [Shewanella sp. 1CM18E]|uniref:TIM-barrel domain-containing protein n=1 Tax=Shewanella sp. 1CM18E TaxID=2929169 RepID=UPI0020C088E7|nr:TIM-barrel domain-containing protein [Shewanella sp. 1CM18E]MCK8044315.1 DUF5110 domain-containing protein [Shewanella sp. 1CM18E]
MRILLLSFAVAGLLNLPVLANQIAKPQPNVLINWQQTDTQLKLNTLSGLVTLSAYGAGAVLVDYANNDTVTLPNYAIAENRTPTKGALTTLAHGLNYCAPQLCVEINKEPFALRFLEAEHSKVISSTPLVEEEAGLVLTNTERGFRFKLDKNEKLLGGGQRVLGMNRRGHKLPLYNKAAYGYGERAEQMYYSLPAVMSSKRYALLFDNSGTGSLDLGKTAPDILEFSAQSGRTSYLVAAGKDYPKLVENLTYAIGRQPLPPRWSLGNFASRFGYRTQDEVVQTVAKFAKQDFPLDALVLDLYWFGKDIKGHMGKLDWDTQAFPEPEKMISDLANAGVNTVLITEPFILTNTERWHDAKANNALAIDSEGKVGTFDFYFGNTSLVDVFSKEGQQWFGDIYYKLMQQGVAGWWGDLGEPEVHPSTLYHRLEQSLDSNVNATMVNADTLHNVYGHQWAAMLSDKLQQWQPQQRPMIMMRSGFIGSQRYGMLPWTGDVARSWSGLKPQVELSLQMGMFGLGYTHSDLGGFAGGEQFDPELYTRWLQYGVFQPIYRPHAQDHIAPEPVFHSDEVQQRLRPFVKLRYQLLPYIYTLAYQNSLSGLPFMRPLMFLDPLQFDNKDSYLFGDAMLVTPVVDPCVKLVKVELPKGVWFDYFSDERFEGGQQVTQAVNMDTLPVLVRAGSFIPTLNNPQTATGTLLGSKDYQTQQLNLDYYFDASVSTSHGEMFDDDGVTPNTLALGQYELLKFDSRVSNGKLTINIESQGQVRWPEGRQITLSILQLAAPPTQVEVNDQSQPLQWQSGRLSVSFTLLGTQATSKIEISLAANSPS